MARMMGLAIGAFAAILAVATTPGFGQTSEARSASDFLTETEGSVPAQLMALLDADGDGRASKMEYRVHMMQVFYDRDRNRDLYLVQKELPRVGPRTFAETDIDGNGRLSAFEFNQAKVLQFESIDADGDGLLSLAELDAFRRSLD